MLLRETPKFYAWKKECTLNDIEGLFSTCVNVKTLLCFSNNIVLTGKCLNPVC